MTKVTKLRAVKGSKTAPPPPPGWLDPAAAEEWTRVAPVLHARGGLTVETEGLLATYCENVATVRLCSESIAKEGITITGPGGLPKPHPLVGMKNRASAIVVQLGKRLGLFTAATASASNKGGGPDDPYAALGIE